MDNNKGRRYIVMDIVFYGSSLNYDQGTGNYQELKKITRWDGKQHTFVSRYALRYSLLKTAEDLGLWKNASGNVLERAGEGDKTVIQPSIKLLLSGEILRYPEFDLFGYLITGTTPQNSKEAPVKISHAISMTPYNYDSHFAGNLGYARKMVEAGKAEKMDPNLFTVEEHQTYYIYTVVIDVDKIGKNEVYLAKKGDKWKADVVWDDEKKIEITKSKERTAYAEFDKDVEIQYELLNGTMHKFEYKLKSSDVTKQRILNIIRAILYLNRDIKARKEILHPKLLVLGIYKGVPYQSYKDRIILTNEYEEIYEEIPEQTKNGGIRIKRRIVKLQKPVFEILGDIPSEPQILDTEQIVGKNSIINNLWKEKELSEVYVFHAPEIEVRYHIGNKEKQGATHEER